MAAQSRLYYRDVQLRARGRLMFLQQDVLVAQNVSDILMVTLLAPPDLVFRYGLGRGARQKAGKAGE